MRRNLQIIAFIIQDLYHYQFQVQTLQSFMMFSTKHSSTTSFISTWFLIRITKSISLFLEFFSYKTQDKKMLKTIWHSPSFKPLKFSQMLQDIEEFLHSISTWILIKLLVLVDYKVYLCPLPGLRQSTSSNCSIITIICSHETKRKKMLEHNQNTGIKQRKLSKSFSQIHD